MLNGGLDLVVVDDNPVLVSVLSEIFSESGFKVRIAANGFGALAEIARRVPDILLSDLRMPGMSGYELLSVVRRRFPSIRVIAMSGGFSAEDIPSGIPADAFYAKGASSVAKLLDMVSSVWLHEASSPRSPTPVWIAETFSDNVKASACLSHVLSVFDPSLIGLTGLILHPGGIAVHTAKRWLKSPWFVSRTVWIGRLFRLTLLRLRSFRRRCGQHGATASQAEGCTNNDQHCYESPPILAIQVGIFACVWD